MKDEKIMSRKNDDWFYRKWRPAMAWMYLVVCLFDFIVGPIFYAWFAWKTKDFSSFGGWEPLTIQGGGLFHLAMGGILGITAWGRTQEKLMGVSVPPPDFYSTTKQDATPAPAPAPAPTPAPTPTPTPALVPKGRPLPKSDQPEI